MDEWNVDTKPPLELSRCQVWTRAGQVRSVETRPGEYYGWVFTDCVHPAQNMLCDDDYIMGWQATSQ